MRLNRLSVILFSALSLPLVACGGDDDGGGGVTVPDAAVIVDAPPAPMPITSGLGKSCSSAQDCAGNGTAVGCLAAPNMPGFCTQVCEDNGSFKTNANAQVDESTIMPATFDDAPCAASYTGTVGSGVCGLIFGRMPTDDPLQANKTYTFQVACTIACSPTNECPGGFTCNTQTKLCDLP